MVHLLTHRRTSGVAVAAAVLSIGLAGQVATPVDPESYAVYRVVVPRELPGQGRVILRQETVTYSHCFPKGRPFEEEWKPVVDDFRLQNATPRTVEAGFDIGRDYLLVPRKEIEAMFVERPDGGWREFYARYPNSGGFIDVSAVGFDLTKTHAMVYVGHYCGGLCGQGTYHLLEKTDGQWRGARLKDGENCHWIS